MDITNKLPSTEASKDVQPVQSVQRTPTTQKAATKQVPRGDRVEISERAKEMQVALEQVKAMPEVDEEKVARIKAQIQAGTYTSDSNTIAEKILTESLLGGD